VNVVKTPKGRFGKTEKYHSKSKLIKNNKWEGFDVRKGTK
jgi:hypothetical protein